jgi:hypothetical protein
VKLDYIPDSDVCFSHAWTPFPNQGGGCGGDSPPTNVARGVQGGEDNFCIPPWRGIQGQRPRSEILGKFSL